MKKIDLLRCRFESVGEESMGEELIWKKQDVVTEIVYADPIVAYELLDKAKERKQRR